MILKLLHHHEFATETAIIYKNGRAISTVLRPPHLPLKQTIESYFTIFSLECFTRIEVVYCFHFDLTLVIAMGIENGHQCRHV